MWTLLSLSAAAQPLGLEMDRPLARGASVTATVTGAAVGDLVLLAASPTAGLGPAPFGQPLGLVAPRVIGTATADATGTATIPFLVPPANPLILLHLQAFDGGAQAEKSEVVDERVYAELHLSTTADATLDHLNQGSRLGASLAFLGDTDGDGSADLAVGQPEQSGGRVLLYAGPISGTLTGSVELARYDGITNGDDAGWSLAPAGDPNGDGLADLLVGAFGLGEAYLVHGGGPAGITRLDLADARLGSGGSGVGYALSGPGDVSGDGVDDLLISAISAGGTGSVLLYTGPVTGLRDAASADGTLAGEAANDVAGSSTCGADVDGDGVRDAVVGADTSSRGAQYGGAVYVVRGPIAGTVPLSTAATIWEGGSVNGTFGRNIVPTGDVDGDGLPDLAVGMPNALLGDGEVRILTDASVPGVRLSAVATARLYGEPGSNTYAGTAIAAGDLDGDSVPDLVVGAPNDPRSGLVYVVYGPLAGTSALSRADVVLTGPRDTGYIGFGEAVAVGDVDGDGLPDVVVGAPRHEPLTSGRAYVFSGSAL